MSPTTWLLDITEVKDECAKKDDSNSIEVEEGPSVVEEDKIQEHWIVNSLLLLVLPDTSLVNMFSIIRTVFNRLKLVSSTLRLEVTNFFMCHENGTFVVCKVTAKQLISTSPPHGLKHLQSGNCGGQGQLWEPFLQSNFLFVWPSSSSPCTLDISSPEKLMGLSCWVQI